MDGVPACGAAVTAMMCKATVILKQGERSGSSATFLSYLPGVGLLALQERQVDILGPDGHALVVGRHQQPLVVAAHQLAGGEDSESRPAEQGDRCGPHQDS